jgi:hypothetical protein
MIPKSGHRFSDKIMRQCKSMDMEHIPVHLNRDVV